MRAHFRGYYAPTDDEQAKLWEKGLVILDTNALLNLYRYSHGSKTEFLKVLDLVNDRLWIPHQVGHEFHRNRLEVIDQQMRAFGAVQESLENAQASVVKTLEKFHRHPSLSAPDIIKKLEKHVSGLSEVITTSQEKHAESTVSGNGNEQIFQQVADLFGGRVGDPYPTEALAEIYKEGAARYAAKIPPGYRDQDKQEPDRYGDLVLWKQILDKAREEPRPAIFVTDDTKEDWWYRVNGKTQGPRVELIEEYYTAAESRIHFYTPTSFISFALGRSDVTIEPDFLSEVEEVSNQRDQPSRRQRDRLLTRRSRLQVSRDRLARQLRMLENEEAQRYASIESGDPDYHNAIELLNWHLAEVSVEIDEVYSVIKLGKIDLIESQHLEKRLEALRSKQSDLRRRILNHKKIRENHFMSGSESVSFQELRRLREGLLEIGNELNEVDANLNSFPE